LKADKWNDIAGTEKESEKERGSENERERGSENVREKTRRKQNVRC
jgi:hypothetical protein